MGEREVGERGRKREVGERGKRYGGRREGEERWITSSVIFRRSYDLRRALSHMHSTA